MAKKNPKTLEIIKDFSEETSIHGIVHIFQTGQSRLGILIWIAVVLLMIWLGSFWSIQSYSDWANSPVLTTVKTSAFPVKQVRR